MPHKIRFANRLQLPIWSLTQERVDKLKAQMVGKKEEHDTLAKRSEKDLWCEDLDNFVAEWELQLKEEAEYQKSIRDTNRRASRKIGAGKGRGKAKAKNDEEYNPKPAKASGPPKIVKVEQQKTSEKFASMFAGKAKPKRKDSLGLDGVEEAEASGISDGDFDALKVIKPTKQVSRAPSEQPGPSNGRVKRAAAAAPKQWRDDDDESESDDDKLLGDVGAMVKGIGGGETLDNANGRVSLFAMSRPGSSHGRATSVGNDLPKVKHKASKTFDFSDGDETNYEMLAKSSPHKAPPVPKDNLDSFLSDEEDLVPITKKIPAKAAAPAAKVPAKRGPKPKAKAVPVKKSVELEPKALSPAAKAYAAKQSKMKLTSKNVFSDDDEDDDIVMGDSPPPKPAAKPSKAKTVSRPTVISDDEEDEVDFSAPPKPVASNPTKKPAPKKKVISDDDDEDDFSALPKPAPKPAASKPTKKKVISDDEDEDVVMDEDDTPPKTAAGRRGRPARAAAVVATAKAAKKPVYIDSDDDDMDVDDLDESAVVEEEQSGDDFDDSD